jgi:hypothetical protein
MWHDTGRAAPVTADRRWLQAWEHYENPETKRRFRNLVEVAGLFDDLVALKPRMATVDEILRFHTRAYVESIRAMSASTGGNAGEATPFGPSSLTSSGPMTHKLDLRHTTRRKDGKVHTYWQVVRSVRVGRKVVQQTVTHLGELDAQGRARVRNRRAPRRNAIFTSPFLGALEAGLVRAMEDAITVLRQASRPLRPMGDEWFQAQERLLDRLRREGGE